MSLQVGQKVSRMGGMGDGQIGFVVANQDGSLSVKLDRGKQELIVPIRSEHEWVLVTKLSLPPMQLARVAYSADRELRIAHAEYGVKDWMSLGERERIAWMQAGPQTKDPERLSLYAAIVEVLK